MTVHEIHIVYPDSFLAGMALQPHQQTGKYDQHLNKRSLASMVGILNFNLQSGVPVSTVSNWISEVVMTGATSSTMEINWLKVLVNSWLPPFIDSPVLNYLFLYTTVCTNYNIGILNMNITFVVGHEWFAAWKVGIVLSGVGFPCWSGT